MYNGTGEEKEKMQGSFWKPSLGGDNYGGSCRLPLYLYRCSDEKQTTRNDEVPTNIVQNTLVIWWSPSCFACKQNEPTFRYLMENPGGFSVHRVEITQALQQRFPHVTTIPRYDVVLLKHGATSTYGKNTELHSIANNDLSNTGLGKYFPGVRSAHGTTNLQ